TVDAQTTVAIDARNGRAIRVATIGGSAENFTAVKDIDGTTMQAAVGEELVLADKQLLEQELIPTDGIARTVISAGIEQFRHQNHAHLKIALNDYCTKEIARNRSRVRLSGSARLAEGRILEHIATA